MMNFIQPLGPMQACSIQPLEEYDEPRAPLTRQVSLDEERLCPGHWKPRSAETFEAAQAVRLLREVFLEYCNEINIEPPICAFAEAQTDPRGWWQHWRDTNSFARAAQRFRRTPKYENLQRRAQTVPLESLDEVEFEDIMQEFCQECTQVEERALCVFNFLCVVCARAIGFQTGGQTAGGWCRAADWAAQHVATVATPWAIRHGGWSAVVYRESKATARAILREDKALIAAGAAAIIAIIFYCRLKLRATAQ